ncbi:MAG: four helix bundle protein [Desulfobacteria bacterium]
MGKSIAEGYGGNKGRVFQNSLTIARRETSEADYWLLLSYELGYMSEETHREAEQGYGEVRSMLSSLISKLGATSDS